VAFATRCTGPSRSSDPAAALRAYRTGISWQTTSTVRSGRASSRRKARAYRRAVEVADVDVVEQRLGLERHRAARQRDRRRLARPLEPRVDTELDRERRELPPELLGGPAAGLGERDVGRRIAVHPPLEVVRRLAVAAEDDDLQALLHGVVHWDRAYKASAVMT
jgi:hypothetical protein